MKGNTLVLCLGVMLLMTCTSEPVMVRQAHKARLVETVRRKLLESVAAEKIAVMETGDEASRAAAQEATTLRAEAVAAYNELRAVTLGDKHPEEVEKLEAFHDAWRGLEEVDQRLLLLAVANTNLKAFRMLTNEGAAALNRFVEIFVHMQSLESDPDRMRVLARMPVAALRTQALLFMHIPQARDAEMAQLEERIEALQSEITSSFTTLRKEEPSEALADAARVWSEYQHLATEVVRLSRANSNVRSREVSVNEKRQATKRCLETLSALMAVIDNGPRATR